MPAIDHLAAASTILLTKRYQDADIGFAKVVAIILSAIACTLFVFGWITLYNTARSRPESLAR